MRPHKKGLAFKHGLNDEREVYSSQRHVARVSGGTGGLAMEVLRKESSHFAGIKIGWQNRRERNP